MNSHKNKDKYGTYHFDHKLRTHRHHTMIKNNINEKYGVKLKHYVIWALPEKENVMLLC